MGAGAHLLEQRGAALRGKAGPGKKSRIGHRVARVDGQLHQRLAHLVFVAAKAGQFRLQKDDQLDVLAQRAPEHRLQVQDDLVELKRRRAIGLRLAEGKQLGRQLRGASCRDEYLLHIRGRGWSELIPSATSAAQPRMPVSKLLKSWAIPPARRPTASIFWE